MHYDDLKNTELAGRHCSGLFVIAGKAKDKNSTLSSDLS